MLRPGAGLVAAILIAVAPAAGQTTLPPGPWVLDVRAITSPVPKDPVFYPELGTGALIPTRGFGVDVGGHFYPFKLGPSRVGFGLNAVTVRSEATASVATAGTGTGTGTGQTGGTGSSTAVALGQRLSLNMRVLAPQVSFNFGTRSGWSYLSAGAGTTRVVAETANVMAGRRETSGLRSLNFGGGARWFIKSHLAFAFDLRFHQISGGTTGAVERAPSSTGTTATTPAASTGGISTPGVRIFSLGAGFSFR